MLRTYSANVQTSDGERTFDFEATSDRDATYIAGKYIRRRIDDLGLDDRVSVIGPNGSLVETTTVEKLARRAE